NLEPVPDLLRRVRSELSASFVAGRPIRVSRAPGRLDVMGGIADYTGSLVCEATLDRAAAVAIQRREDRQVQIISLNLLDENQPFTLTMALDDLARTSIDMLRGELDEPGRRWGGYLLGCLAVLHEQGLVDLRSQDVSGMNVALLSTVPLGAGVSSSAAIEVATMIGLMDELGIARSLAGPVDPMRVASLCQRVENHVVGAPCGIMDQATSCYGQAGELLRLVCQPHELQPSLKLPAGIRAIGINSNVKHSVGGGQYGITRCAGFMGHKMIHDKIAEIGRAGGRELNGDPMNGYLANLPVDDYKRMFRQFLPEFMNGGEFLQKHGQTIDTATRVDASIDYPVQHATDHHVLEAMRVRNFVAHITDADTLAPGDPKRKLALDKAGHLMYASHLSYTNEAMLGADECDALVDLVRASEPEGLYGAKITGGGSGGTVAVLAAISPRADVAIEKIIRLYQQKTGRSAEAFLTSSPGAWHVGSVVIDP
ncbi:MAG TPA: galactokinase family protein, partial [Tepidisphaeraceae bacterium]|nr:galactokinase family protein [Tepidisphaeraceae bacterium]